MPPPASQPRLRTLGDFSRHAVLLADDGAALVGPGKPLALLAYLAAAPQRSASRAQLVDLLWSNASSSAGRHSLSQALSYLRQRAGADLLVARGEDLTLAHRIAVDRDDFLAAALDGRHDDVVATYAGDFLACFGAPGAAELERWADGERQRLRALFVRSAEAVVRRDLSAGRARAACALARRVRDGEPLSQRAWRLLLECLVATRDVAGAALEADALEQLLRAEDVAPEPATAAALALARRAGADEGGAAESRDGAPGAALVAELVGRESEFSALVSAWEAARRGAPRHVHVSGGAGLGKSRLVGDAAARLRTLRARVVLVRARPGERHLAYALASDVARALAALPGSAGVSPATAGALVALDPTLSATYPSAPADRSEGEEALRRRTLALLELVRAVAEERPLALIVDDLHWADPLSRQALLGALGKLEAGDRVLVVTCARPVPEGRAALAETVALPLQALTPAHVGALVASLGALSDAPWARRLPDVLHAATGGAPLLVLETLHVAVERHALVLTEDGWRCDDPDRLLAALDGGSAMRRRVADSDPESRWLLLLIATAGAPVALPLLARAMRRPEAVVDGFLFALEQRGLVSRIGADDGEGAEWQPGHDQVGELASDIAGADAVREAHAALGAALLEVAEAHTESHPALARRAGAHLWQGGDRERLRRLFARWSIGRRRAGDTRSLAALAHDLLGGGPLGSAAALETEVREIVRGVPPLRRLAWRIGWPQAAAAVLLLGGAGAAYALRQGTRDEPPDATLVFTGADAEYRIPDLRVALHEAGWSAADDGVNATRTASPDLPASPGRGNLRQNSIGTAWLFDSTVAEGGSSGNIDVFLDAGGRVRRLTDAPGDDMGADWSPDGREIVFMTKRWTAVTATSGSLAVLDLAGETVRPLVRDVAYDVAPRWSPDGSRIAFVRHWLDEGRVEICWVTARGGVPRCFAGAPYRPNRVDAWTGPNEIVLAADSAGEAMLVGANLTAQTSVRLARGDSHLGASPDGRWGACLCRPDPDRPAAWAVFSLERPALQRIVLLNGQPLTVGLPRWVLPRRTERSITQVKIERPQSALPAGTSYQARAAAFDRAGRLVPLPGGVARWSSRDTAVVSMSTDGLIVPRSPGTALLSVEIGGRASDTARVVVRAARVEAIAAEGWRSGWRDRWRPYGVPAGEVVPREGSGASFWNAGDDSFPSGAYLQRPLDAPEGVGVEAVVSTPFTRRTWQWLHVGLVAGWDSLGLAKWDHRHGPPPWRGDAGDAASCAASLSGTGVASDGLLVTTGARVLRAGDHLTTGHRYRVRVQILPDGRCGVAIDGQQLHLSSTRIPIDERFLVVLQGNSVGTRLLVDSIAVWRGVRSDVAWTERPNR